MNLNINTSNVNKRIYICIGGQNSHVSINDSFKKINVLVSALTMHSGHKITDGPTIQIVRMTMSSFLALVAQFYGTNTSHPLDSLCASWQRALNRKKSWSNVIYAVHFIEIWILNFVSNACVSEFAVRMTKKHFSEVLW